MSCDPPPKKSGVFGWVTDFWINAFTLKKGISRLTMYDSDIRKHFIKKFYCDRIKHIWVSLWNIFLSSVGLTGVVISEKNKKFRNSGFSNIFLNFWKTSKNVFFVHSVWVWMLIQKTVGAVSICSMVRWKPRNWGYWIGTWFKLQPYPCERRDFVCNREEIMGMQLCRPRVPIMGSANYSPMQGTFFLRALFEKNRFLINIFTCTCRVTLIFFSDG